jgi:hypothetical protein
MVAACTHATPGLTGERRGVAGGVFRSIAGREQKENINRPPEDDLPGWWNLAATLAVVWASNAGSTPMWKSVLDEAREVMWLASVIGGLSAMGVGLAVVLAAA